MFPDLRLRFQRINRVASQRPLADFLAGRFMAMLGVWIFRVTVAWVVWDLTKSATMVGLTTAAMLGPQVLLGPISGALADRHDRKRLLAVTNVVNGVVKSAAGVSLALGLIGVNGLLAFIVAAGITGALAQASAKTIVSAMVEETDLASAISLNSVLFNLAGFLGPACAGLIIKFSVPAVGLVVSGLLALLFVVLLGRVPSIPRPERPKSGFMADIAEGFRYTMNEPYIRLLMVLHAASATLARPFLDFIPALVSSLFQGGPGWVAATTSAVGIGSVCGGLWLAQRDNSGGMLPVVLGAFVSLSVVLIAFAWAPSLYLVLPLAFLAGIGMILRAASLQTIFQTEADEPLRGRVVSLYSVVLNGGAIFGALFIGLIGDTFGLSAGLTISVLGALLVWVMVQGPLRRMAADRAAATSPG